MILKYVLKNFRRRKVRTILMILSLLVSTGLIVALSATVETIRRSNVELIASGTGRYDIAVQKTETSPDPFVEVARTTETILQTDDRVTAVHPRFQAPIEFSANGELGRNYTLLALDTENDDVGIIEVISGTYRLGEMGTAVLQSTADSHNLKIGDTVEVAYSFPQPREEGKAGSVGSSQRQAVGRFTVQAIVRQNGVTDAGMRDGLIIDIGDMQAWLGLPNRAQQLIVTVDPALYEARDAEAAALGVRNVAVAIQTALGDTYSITLPKATVLDQASQAFLVLQALINTYGFLALGVVGLLVYTLVMTNVQEQRREMAILRILGSQRNYLFAIVIAEVLVIGLIGVGLGVVLGQFITQYAVIPFIEYQMSQAGLNTTIQPAVSLTTILPPTLSAFGVLLLSAMKPAQEAARTKVIHAINPGVADNIQLEDLEELREKRPNLKLFVIGLGMMFVVLLTLGLDIVSTLGNPAIEAAIFLAVLLMMLVGLGFVFLILTRPLEKLLLLTIGLLAPRLTYFARRNVSRSHARNTLISLLVLFSGILPSLLATQSAIDNANLETDVRLDMGAPITVQSFTSFGSEELAQAQRLRPNFVHEELKAVPGIADAVGLSYDYFTNVTDPVGMRNASISLVGVDGDLNDVLFSDMVIFSAGGPESLTALQNDPNSVIISEGLAKVLAVPLGGTIKITGEGLDHVTELKVIGIAQRIPGFNGIGQMRAPAQSNSTVFISLEGFRHLITPPQQVLPDSDDPVLDRVLADLAPGADAEVVLADMRERFTFDQFVWMDAAEVRLELARSSRVQQQAFLLVLTLISFTTAVFGVFAVTYVTIYARRKEIGMMKAVGTRNWELAGMLSIEAIAMTLSAALAGIVAGAAMAYLFAYTDNITQQRPQMFAVDTTVMPFIVFLVVLASILGTVFSARRIIKRRAVEILRMG